MKQIMLITISLLVLSGCARIPVQGVELASALQEEAAKMHSVNTLLLHAMFIEKQKAVDVFIVNEYTPALAENFKKLVPADTDIKKELAPIMQYITPAIQAKRDSLLTVLRVQENKILRKMESDHASFDRGMDGVKRLLQSETKIKSSKKELGNTVKELPGRMIDMEALEEAIAGFIRNAGNISAAKVSLESAVNKILQNSK